MNPTVFNRLGVRRVVNASGKMTHLGGSVLSPSVAAAMAEGGRQHVVLDELIRAVGKQIAESTGAEAGCPTLGAAAGIAIAVAACVAGRDQEAIEALPWSEGRVNRVVLMKGHAVHFGAPITQMIRLGGGVPVEIGHANLCLPEHLESALAEPAAAVLYVKSHHAVQKGMLPLAQVVAAAHHRGVPVIVDAAAEEDLRAYVAAGADLVLYSGGKAIGGPTSGLIAGKAERVEACCAQYTGIGRAMKVSKEALAGLSAALEEYQSRTGFETTGEQRRRMEALAARLAALPGLSTRVVQDEAGRTIYRVEVQVEPATAGLTAAELAHRLEAGDPAVYVRGHYLNTGRFQLDPRPLSPSEEEIVVQQMAAALTQSGEEDGENRLGNR